MSGVRLFVYYMYFVQLQYFPMVASIEKRRASNLWCVSVQKAAVARENLMLLVFKY